MSRGSTMKDLTEGNIYKTFLIFAIPLILAGFLSQAYSIIDTVIAGRILNYDGLAAIGSTSAFIQFFSSIFWGYGVGFSIYVAPLLLCSVLFARGFCSVFLPKGSTGEGLDMSVTFARYFLPFILFNLVNNLFHSFYRGIAAMKFLVAATLIGSISRIIATYFAVKYFAMNGVYLGWVISWIIECMFSLGIYFTGAWKTDEIKALV
mgnify:CR=1 FL=1